MLGRVNAYLRAVAPLGREAAQVGPFLATCTPASDDRYVNYAVPDDGATPAAGDVAALVAWYEARGRIPRLEYVASAAPAVEPALLDAGFTVEGRLPVMVFDAGSSPAPPPDGFDVRLAESDDDLLGMMTVEADAYDLAAPPSRGDVPARRAALARGGIAVVALDLASGAAVGAGSCTPIVEGLAEVAGIGVRASHRRRGIGQAVARRLADEAIGRGAETPFLMAGHDEGARVYRRAGFVDAGDILHISRPAP